MQNLMAFQPDIYFCIGGGGGEGGGLLDIDSDGLVELRVRMVTISLVASPIEGFYASLCNVLLWIDNALHGRKQTASTNTDPDRQPIDWRNNSSIGLDQPALILWAPSVLLSGESAQGSGKSQPDSAYMQRKRKCKRKAQGRAMYVGVICHSTRPVILWYTEYFGIESIRGFEWMDVVTLWLLRRAGCYWLVYMYSACTVLVHSRLSGTAIQYDDVRSRSQVSTLLLQVQHCLLRI